MKKVSLSLLALALTSTVASAAGQFQGFYTGASTGYSRHKLDASAKLNTIIGNAKSKSDKTSHGAIFDAFFGYGATLGQSGFYLGGELGLGYDTAHSSSTKRMLGNSVKFTTNNSFFYNASARLGYAISNQTLIYTRLGYQVYNKDAKSSVNGGSSKKYKRDGMILGFGVDHALTKNVFIRGEYKHNFGHRYTSKHTLTGITSVKTKVETSSHAFLLGIGYKF